MMDRCKHRLVVDISFDFPVSEWEAKLALEKALEEHNWKIHWPDRHATGWVNKVLMHTRVLSHAVRGRRAGY